MGCNWAFKGPSCFLPVPKNLCHLFHISPIWLKLDRSIKDLPGRKLYNKEHCTVDKFVPYKKLYGKEVTGG